MFKKKKKSSEELKPLNPPHEKCLNCGAELKGKYCHACGQEAVGMVPSIRKFIMVYVNHTFVWDPRFFRTLKLLVMHPGQLTNEYISGKHHGQEHPIKLNMFLLFIFITLFVFCSSPTKLSHSVEDLTQNELISPALQMSTYVQNEANAEKLKSSSRDTILLQAPLMLTREYGDVIVHVETIEDSKGQTLDKWKAVVSHALIEDSIIVRGESDDYYHFEMSAVGKIEEIAILVSVWEQMVKICTKYFPMMVLFTAPLVAFTLRLVQRREKRPRIHHLVFALHYTALLELLILLIYVLHLTIAPPVGLLQWLLIIVSCAYLTLAFRSVYGVKSWAKAVAKAIFTSLCYFCIILLIFVVVSLVACFVVAVGQAL